MKHFMQRLSTHRDRMCAVGSNFVKINSLRLIVYISILHSFRTDKSSKNQRTKLLLNRHIASLSCQHLFYLARFLFFQYFDRYYNLHCFGVVAKLVDFLLVQNRPNNIWLHCKVFLFYYVLSVCLLVRMSACKWSSSSAQYLLLFIFNPSTTAQTDSCVDVGSSQASFHLITYVLLECSANQNKYKI